MPSISKINSFVQLTRPYNATAVLLSFSIGYFFSLQQILNINYFAGAIIVLLLHSSATIQNDIEDFKIDKINAPEKPLQGKRISLKEAKIFQLILVICALAISLINFYIHFIFVVLMFIASYLYNKKPFLLSRKSFSSLAILGLVYSLGPILYGYILSKAQLTLVFILILIFWFFLRVSISIMKDYKDKKGDKIFNKKTFYLTFGNTTVAWTSIILSIFGYLGILLMSLFIRRPNWILVFLLVVAIRNVYSRVNLLTIRDDKKANIIFHKAFFGQNQFEALYFLWLIFLSN